MPRLLEFDKLHNIRDIGGMKSADGREIAEGRLIRCGNLSELTESDKLKLSDLVEVVIDFRTDGEREEKPDIELPGVEYYHIPIIDSLTEGITREASADEDIFTRLLLKPAEAKEYMRNMYRQFVERDIALSRYGEFIRLLAKPHSNAVLWHCTAGKDRAGIASAIVEELLGVSREDITEDYLRTNEYLNDDIIFLTQFVKKRANTESDLADESARYLFGADREYIDAFYDALDERFGSFRNFVTKGLKVSDSECEALEKYLV